MIGMLDLGMQILKGLAVLGGAALGGSGSGWLFRLLVRFSFQRSVPPKILLLVRVLGAAALALAVWVWLSSPGGSGPGWGGLLGSAGSGHRQVEPGAKAAAPAELDSAPGRPGSESLPRPGKETLQIDILGGERVQQERFYLLEGDPEPRTLSEIRKAIQARRQQRDQPPLKGIVVMIYGTSAARDHPAVKNLAKWAEDQNLSVTFPPTSGAAP